MKLVVFGGSRGLGRQVVHRALEDGHHVTVFARRPEQSGLDHPGLRLIAGNILDAESVRRAVTDQDAAICTLGIPTLQAMGLGNNRILSVGTANIVTALEQQGVRRFICETAIGTGNSARDCTPLARLAFRVVLRHLFLEKDRQEDLTRKSALDWLIVRPTALTNGPRTGRYQEGERLPSGILTQVSRADVADFIVKQSTRDGLKRTAVMVSYPPRFGDGLRWARHYR